jgi:hypothetical protein
MLHTKPYVFIRIGTFRYVGEVQRMKAFDYKWERIGTHPERHHNPRVGGGPAAAARPRSATQRVPRPLLVEPQ